MILNGEASDRRPIVRKPRPSRRDLVLSDPAMR
jgi:hypothetical protein